MTTADKLKMLQTMTGEQDGTLLSTYLMIAESKVLRRAYPFDAGKAEVPACYEMKQLEIAAYLINKRGAEGETAHSENGISRTYEDGDVPPSMLREIVPFVGVL